MWIELISNLDLIQLLFIYFDNLFSLAKEEIVLEI